MPSRNPFPFLTMSKADVMAKRNLSEAEYERFARKVGLQIDLNKKIRQTIDACQNPWSIMQRFKDLAKISHTQEELEVSLTTANPMQLILEYIHWTHEAYHRADPETFIANNIRGITESCFCRYGDRNSITPKIRKNWITKRALEVDIAAMELSNLAGFDIQPEDIVNFIIAHENGQQDYILFQNLEAIASAFQRLAGFKLNLYYSRTILQELESRQPIEAWEDCPF